MSNTVTKRCMILVDNFACQNNCPQRCRIGFNLALICEKTDKYMAIQFMEADDDSNIFDFVACTGLKLKKDFKKIVSRQFKWKGLDKHSIFDLYKISTRPNNDMIDRFTTLPKGEKEDQQVRILFLPEPQFLTDEGFNRKFKHQNRRF